MNWLKRLVDRGYRLIQTKPGPVPAATTPPALAYSWYQINYEPYQTVYLVIHGRLNERSWHITWNN